MPLESLLSNNSQKLKLTENHRSINILWLRRRARERRFKGAKDPIFDVQSTH